MINLFIEGFILFDDFNMVMERYIIGVRELLKLLDIMLER